MNDIHLWEAKHSYYCNEGNYFGNNVGQHYKTLQDFLDEWEHSDMDYNLLFRWDWEDSSNPDYELEKDRLLIFWMLQRKGLYMFCTIDVDKTDEVRVIDFLQPRLEHLYSLWQPLESHVE